MSVFEKALDGLLKFVMAQAAILLIASALAVPPQKLISPPSDCLAGYEVYLRANLLRYYLIACLFTSSGLAIVLEFQIKAAGEFSSLSATGKKTARAVMVVAVLFSAAGSVVAIATHSYYQQSTTVLHHCLPLTDRVAIYICYTVFAVGGIAYPAFAFLKPALFASE